MTQSPPVLVRPIYLWAIFWCLWIVVGNALVAQTEDHEKLVFGDHSVLKSKSFNNAIERSATLLRASSDRYPANRQCFSCHHQTLPLFAIQCIQDASRVHHGMRLTKKQSREVSAHVWFGSDRERVASNVDLTVKSIEKQLNELGPNDSIDGKDLTVGYALWTLDLAGFERGPLTDRLVKYLLGSQQEDGSWTIHSVRPPAASSNHMATALAMLGLVRFGLEPDTPGVETALLRASVWHRMHEDSESIEDMAGYVWAEYLLRSLQSGHRLESVYAVGSQRTAFDLSIKILERQQADGGWAQEPGMESDAYATGMCLVMLAQVDDDYRFGAFRRKHFLAGVQFLIDTQHENGAWFVSSRANPVQEYFDNGDPFDTDQFISVMATGWAAAALGAAKHRNHYPLGRLRDY